VARWSESLVNGAVLIGSPMRPMRLSARPSDIEQSIHFLRRLLELGFGYVGQGDADPGSSESSDGVLVGMLDRVRATLPLCAQAAFLENKKRRARLRDVARVLRSQAGRGRTFSLRVNSNLTLALAKLQEHHEDNWVGGILEHIWRIMFDRGELLVFELWALEANSEKMIAADFGHPHSTLGFYVATRFFDRDYKTCMPGFILAFAEAQFLFRNGFGFWDLGGTNSSPMMSYKPQVALELTKESFLDLLIETQRRARSGPGPTSIHPGIAIAEIKEEDLWSATACKEHASSGGTKKAKQKERQNGGAQAPKLKLATTPGSMDSARVKFQALFQELRGQGMESTDAAAESLRRLTTPST